MTKFIVAILMITLLGSILQTWGGSWDITSHQLGEPETFFTPPHGVLYIGVGIGLIAAIMSVAVMLKKREILKKSFSLGLKLIIIGCVFQIIAGPSDYYWHEMFGTDGLLSPTHLTLITGILIQSVGIVIGLARLIHKNFRVVKPSLILAFGVLWFITIGFIFQFTLPISTGDTIDLDPDPYIAAVIAASALPFFSVLIFWSSAKTIGRFGGATLVTVVFIILNITSNIIPAEFLWGFLPWFALPVILGIVSDALISSKIKIKRFGEELAGAIIGSMFLVFSMPLIGMAYIQFHIFNGVSGYELLPDFADTLGMILGIMSIPGAIMGWVAVKFAKRKIAIPAELA
ncbi:hypothetical protein NZNM25_09870 [Nitrosopumilus zosterae]|uniref:Uncharacterized protein n=1 Tax=Nitrosopumilus zosterae TaxID=718286 RepID=A0A2S2KRA8_9ARCH|nr:hypothetical protein [Nitrosopumilus zosterae]BDQ30371.1 hypothetical protein NZOSNM25_000473 [Nitrosopumilus zosterae]GBH34196.1 hypothetical protein NZNM25_09870 [Nitrosopumilus zosterae]